MTARPDHRAIGEGPAAALAQIEAWADDDGIALVSRRRLATALAMRVDETTGFLAALVIQQCLTMLGGGRYRLTGRPYRYTKAEALMTRPEAAAAILADEAESFAPVAEPVPGFRPRAPALGIEPVFHRMATDGKGITARWFPISLARVRWLEGAGA